MRLKKNEIKKALIKILKTKMKFSKNKINFQKKNDMSEK